MVYAYILICILFAFLVAESWIIRKNVHRIRIRIHINGTRGKSSTTRYISAALRHFGLKTTGKITGEIPGIIKFDGTFKPIRRSGPPRIQEQFRIIRRSAAAGTDALVLECMSIDPALQKVESSFFNPGIYVITNIKNDHREKMGLDPEQRIKSICQAIPQNAVVITNDTENIEAIRRFAEKNHSRLIVPLPLPWKEAEKLPPDVFPANIELAEEAAVQAGMDRKIARKAILDHISKSGSHAISKGCEKFTFLNAFSVNDPESASQFLNKWIEKLAIQNKLIFIFNTRSDRPLRTDIFSGWIKERSSHVSRIFITGNHRERAYRNLSGLMPGIPVRKLSTGRIKGLSNIMQEMAVKEQLVVGIGNIKGDGYRVLKEFGL